eukprot:403356728
MSVIDDDQEGSQGLFFQKAQPSQNRFAALRNRDQLNRTQNGFMDSGNCGNLGQNQSFYDDEDIFGPSMQQNFNIKDQGRSGKNSNNFFSQQDNQIQSSNFNGDEDCQSLSSSSSIQKKSVQVLCNNKVVTLQLHKDRISFHDLFNEFVLDNQQFNHQKTQSYKQFQFFIRKDNGDIIILKQHLMSKDFTLQIFQDNQQIQIEIKTLQSILDDKNDFTFADEQDDQSRIFDENSIKLDLDQDDESIMCDVIKYLTQNQDSYEFFRNNLQIQLPVINENNILTKPLEEVQKFNEHISSLVKFEHKGLKVCDVLIFCLIHTNLIDVAEQITLKLELFKSLNSDFIISTLQATQQTQLCQVLSGLKLLIIVTNSYSQDLLNANIVQVLKTIYNFLKHAQIESFDSNQGSQFRSILSYFVKILIACPETEKLKCFEELNMVQRLRIVSLMIDIYQQFSQNYKFLDVAYKSDILDQVLQVLTLKFFMVMQDNPDHHVFQEDQEMIKILDHIGEVVKNSLSNNYFIPAQQKLYNLGSELKLLVLSKFLKYFYLETSKETFTERLDIFYETVCEFMHTHYDSIGDIINQTIYYHLKCMNSQVQNLQVFQASSQILHSLEPDFNYHNYLRFSLHFVAVHQKTRVLHIYGNLRLNPDKKIYLGDLLDLCKSVDDKIGEIIDSLRVRVKYGKSIYEDLTFDKNGWSIPIFQPQELLILFVEVQSQIAQHIQIKKVKQANYMIDEEYEMFKESQQINVGFNKQIGLKQLLSILDKV